MVPSIIIGTLYGNWWNNSIPAQTHRDSKLSAPLELIYCDVCPWENFSSEPLLIMSNKVGDISSRILVNLSMKNISSGFVFSDLFMWTQVSSRGQIWLRFWVSLTIQCWFGNALLKETSSCWKPHLWPCLNLLAARTMFWAEISLLLSRY